jgi:hypothetical protein
MWMVLQADIDYMFMWIILQTQLHQYVVELNFFCDEF